MSTSHTFDVPGAGTLADADQYLQANSTLGGRSAYATGAQVKLFVQTPIDAALFADADTAAAAAYALGRPLYIASGTATLTIDPTAEAEADTDAARFAVLQDACDWQAKCITRGTGEIEIFIADGGHQVEGQILRGDFETSAHMPPLILTSNSPTVNAITTAANGVTFGANAKRVTHVSVSAGGTGFSGPTFAVTFSGGAGTGATATAYTSGGVITSIVVTNGGSGFTGVPTVDVSAGGGSGATCTAVINGSIWPVTLTLTDALPAHIAAGMPIGVRDVAGNNDCGAVNGAGILTSFDTNAKTITYDVTLGSWTGTATTGTATAGEVVFPKAWLSCAGGFTGSVSGKEAFINANNLAQVKIKFLGFRWVDGTNQGRKTSQSFYHCGVGYGELHMYDDSVAVGFPGRILRISSGNSTVNTACLSGGIYGTDVMLLQNGGNCKLIRSAVGGCKSNVITVGIGNSLIASETNFAGGARGVYVLGGNADIDTCLIHACVRGAVPTDLGRIIADTSLLINRCVTSLDWTGGGTIVGPASHATQITNSISVISISSIQQGTASLGGGWFAISGDQRLRAATTQLVGTGFASLTASPAAGMLAYVTDSNTAVLKATIAAGGANKVLAFYDGSNWIVGASLS